MKPKWEIRDKKMGPAGKEELKTGDEERSKREGKSEEDGFKGGMKKQKLTD